MLKSAERGKVTLIKNFNPYDHDTPTHRQADGRTDGQLVMAIPRSA